MYNNHSRQLSRYLNTFIFMRKIESTILIQRWWRKMIRKNKNIIKDIILR